MNHPSKQSGVTMIEVVITMFVMTVGLLGLAGLQSTSVKDSLDTAKRSQAAWLVSEVVERIRANPNGQDTGYTANISTEDCAKPAKQCADTHAGDAATDCTANEMAAFDLWDTFCGEVAADTLANSTESLNLTNLTVSCDGLCSAPQAEFTVSISWNAQPATDSKMLSDEAIEAQKIQTISMTVRP